MRVGPAAFGRAVSWGGALIFVISLVYFFFTYLVRFSAVPARGNAAAAVTWNVTLFTVFAVHHSVFARERVRRWVARTLPAELERSFYIWIASLLFIVICAGWKPVAGVAWQADGAALWALRILQAAGLWLVLRSAAVLDVWELAGLNQAGGAGAAGGAVSTGPTRPTEFRATGPYGWVRHPIYSGWFVFVCAASPMTMTRLVFAIVSCAYLLIAIRWEEQSMRAASEGGYARYMARVRWRLLPGVY